MKKNLLIISLGFFSLSVQSILVREFLNTLESNELSIGLFFFSWFFWIFPGSLLSRLLKNKSNFFPILSLLYIPSWLFGHFLITNAHSIYKVPTYETFPIVGTILFAFVTPSLVSATTGLLFPIASLWWEKSLEVKYSEKQDSLSSKIVRQVYALEAFGAVLGGIITTLAILYGFTIWIPFILSGWLLGLSVLLQFRNTLLSILHIFILPGLLTAGIYIDKAESKITWEKVLKEGVWNNKIITQQAEYIFGTKGTQTIILKNKKIFLTLPNDEYGLNLTATILAQKQNVKNIALIGEKLIYSIPFLSKVKTIEKIIWLPTDYEIGKSILREMGKYYSIDLQRISIPYDEPRKYISNSKDKFDAIIVNIGDPTTLSLSRYTTELFFEILNSHITEEGIVAISLTGGENFLGSELAYYGASIFNTISQVFPITAIKPGEESFIFASNKFPISEHTPTLENRLKEVSTQIPEINPTIVRNLYPPDRIKFQKDIYNKILNEHNKDTLLITEENISSFLFSILFYLSKAGYRGIINHLPAIERIIKIFSIGAPLLFIIFRILYKIKRSKNQPHSISIIPESIFAITAIGASAIGINLIWLTIFQFTYGSLTTFIGILSASFMLGISIAPFIYDWIPYNRKIFYELFIAFLLLITTLAVLYYLLIKKETSILYYSLGFLNWGLLVGLLISIILERLKPHFDTSYISTHLEIWDHIGACIGSIAIPLLLLPIAGLNFSIVAIAFLLITAIITFFLLKPVKAPVSYLWGRKVGYFLTPVFLIIMACSISIKSSSPTFPENEFYLVAKQMVQEEILYPAKQKVNDTEIQYFEIRNPQTEETLGYIFSTASLFKVIGYAGEIDLAVRVSKDGTIENVSVISSEETPEYFSRVEDYLFIYKGKNIFSPDTIESVDVISGATTSSEAVKRAVKFAGEKFAKIITKESETAPLKLETRLQSNLPISFYTLLLFTLLALLLRYRKSKSLRYVWLVLVTLALGMYFNLQLSTYHILLLLNPKTYLSINLSAPFLLLAIGVLIVPLFGNVYCGYLCPFGAISELVGEINFIYHRISPSYKAWYFARQIKYWILFILVSTYLLTSDPRIISADPLITFFNFEFTSLTFAIGVIAIILSILYKRFWCRVICPTGALLSILQSFRILSKIWQRTLPSKCDLGIKNKEEIDCIQCNRCYYNEKK